MRRDGGGGVATIAWYVGGLTVLAILVGYLVWAEPEIKLHSKTMCPIDSTRGPPRSTAIVLDRTDPITEVQQQDIIEKLKVVFDKSAPFERFVIYSLDARKDIVLDGMVLCNPIKPKQGGALDVLSSDTDFETKFFREKFLDPLMKKVTELLPTASTTQPDSPIMEMVQAVAVRDLKRSPAGRLILVSDMMQYSTRHSQYKNFLPFEAFAKSIAFREVSVDLSNTSVTLLYITRTRGPSKQPDGHKEFWQEYFSALRARPVVVETIRGEAWN